MDPEAGSEGFASINQAPAVKRLRVLTVNTHKGFTAFNRRFILPELREAVRSTQADIVFLQEVLGSHDRHAARYPGWPQTSQYEFLADSMWSDFAYGRNAVYPDGHHGNALLSKYPIIEHRNLDVSITGPERRGLCTACWMYRGKARYTRSACTCRCWKATGKNSCNCCANCWTPYPPMPR